MFNAGFDILKSRSIRCFGKKKAISDDNIKEIYEFTNLMITYIKGLKLKEKDNFIHVLESNRKTGFL